MFLFAIPTLAGGWPVSIWTWDNPEFWKDGSKLTYVRAHIAPDVPCIGTTVTFKYENPQPGDNVSAGGDNGTFTFTEQGSKYSKFNGTMIPDCNTYAKFYSTNNTEKTAIVEFKTQSGTIYSRKYALNFHLPNPGNIDSAEKYPLPWEEDYIKNHPNVPAPTTAPQLPAGNPSVWLLGQQLVAPYGRQVTIKYGWSQTQGNIHYNIYTKIIYKGDNDWQKAVSADRGPSTTLSLRSDVDYKIRVDGCLDKFGNCVSSNELELSKIKQDTAVTVKEGKVEQQFNKEQVKTESSDAANLQQKVDELQRKLETSQQRQVVLETRLNQIISWIKSIFPFFR